MIDPDWFTQAACLSGADLAGSDPAVLRRELGVEEEVFPYLILSAGGFADWPQTQTALTAAWRSIARPGLDKPGVATPPATGHLRKAMRDEVRMVLESHACGTADNGEAARPFAADALIDRYKSALASDPQDPACFILPG